MPNQNTRSGRDRTLNVGNAGGITYLAANTTLTPDQRLVHVKVTDTITLTLPPVAQAAGLEFMICVYAVSGTPVLAVVDGADGSYAKTTVGNMTAVGDYVHLACNGLSYYELAELST